MLSNTMEHGTEYMFWLPSWRLLKLLLLDFNQFHIIARDEIENLQIKHSLISDVSIEAPIFEKHSEHCQAIAYVTYSSRFD